MTFYEPNATKSGSRPATSCLALALVVAGLVAGYTLSLTEQLLRGQPAAVLTHLRKLYDPQQFPGAAVLPIFDRIFGSQRSGVCAIGVEANPHHTQYLEQLNGFFKSRRYQAVVLTETAASIKTGTASFFLDHSSDQQSDVANPTEWAASLQQGTWHQGQATVPLLDLPSFVMDVVRPILQQEQHSTGRRPPVVMKLDVEGEEYALLPGLMLSGGLCELDMLFMEQHDPKMRSADGIKMKLKDMEKLFARLRSARPGCKVNITDLDDESYVNGRLVPLPTWHVTPEQQAKGYP
ncbi:hypothetical protein OEZ86_007159 [Tetradesmus obliquus]|nr:hypothetical protein OEZ86_007159 [Tetradesmus obliquus]